MPKPSPRRPAVTVTELAARLLLWGWAWRTELATVTLVVAARNLLDASLGLGDADLIVAVVLVVVFACGPLRGMMLRLLLGAERRRRWHTPI